MASSPSESSKVLKPPLIQWTASLETAESGAAFRSEPGQETSSAPRAISTSLPTHEESFRRRSSVAEGIGSIANVGGVNSLTNFARSWQRAAGFYEVTQAPRTVQYSSDLLDEQHERRISEHATRMQTSLLRTALENEGRRTSELSLEDGREPLQRIPSRPSEEIETRLRKRRESLLEDNIFQIQPQLGSSFGYSYGATGEGGATHFTDAASRHAGRLFNAQQAGGISVPDKERVPLLVKRVEPENGKPFNVVVGQSTLPQTIFNSMNVLVGVGLLCLPLALRYSGWLIGLIFLSAAAITTSYTAKLLAKCLDVDPTLITFADLAYISFGTRTRIAISLLFTMELLGTCVALVILFADSIDALVPGWGITEFKVVCGIIVLPLGFLPLRYLSFTSILGILSCLGIVIAVFVDGLIKPDAPGSLRDPAGTYLFPKDWRTLPLAFGLLMAPWGGHSVFPNLYRDMRHPYKYGKCVNITLAVTYFLDTSMAVVGYLMFGKDSRDEVTSNILYTNGYPHWINIFIVVAVAIIPITKIPLNARPIISTLEIYLGLDSRALPNSSSLTGMSGLTRGILKLTIRIGMPLIFVIIAILVPSFDRVMALLGSLACFTICIILPCSFHLRMFGKHLSPKQRMLDWTLIVICSLLAAAGTISSVLPRRLLGADR